MRKADQKHPIDLHIGAKIRECRVTRGMSQGALGAATGVTFQQIQKYERGTNRISGSRLWDLARALEVLPGYFYEGLTGGGDSDTPMQEKGKYSNLLVVRHFQVLPTNVQGRVLALLKAMAGAEDEAA